MTRGRTSTLRKGKSKDKGKPEQSYSHRRLTRARTVAELETHTTTLAAVPTQAKTGTTRRARAKANWWTWCSQVSLEKRLRGLFSLFFPSLSSSVQSRRAPRRVDPDHGTLSSLLQESRQSGAEYLLLDSGPQFHACPTEYPGHKEYIRLTLGFT